MSCWFAASLSLVADADVQDLAAQGQDGLRRAIARLLGRAAGGIALDDEELGVLGRVRRAVGELAGQAQLAARRLAGDVLLGLLAQPLLGALDDEVEQAAGLGRRIRQPMVERVAHDAVDEARRLARHQAALVLALEFRLADEHGDQRRAAAHHVVGGDAGDALGLADALGVVLERAQQRDAQARLVGAAVRRRDRVAIGMDEAVVVREPRDGPFDRAVPARLLDLAGEGRLDDRVLALDVAGQIVAQAAGEAEHRLGRDGGILLQQRRVALPADFDAAEEIGLRARHAEQARRLEVRARAEDLRVGLEAHPRAAPVVDAAHVLELRDRQAALEALQIELLAARHFHVEPRRQRVDHRDADAMQAAGGLVGARIELSARVQRGHDDFEGGFLREFRMRVDGDAATVVGHGQPVAGLQHDLDPRGVAGHGLVHGIVEDFGEQVMQRGFVGAADVHARPPAHGLQPLQNLDGGGRVARFTRRAAHGFGRLAGGSRGSGCWFGGRLARRAAAEEIAVGSH